MSPHLVKWDKSLRSKGLTIIDVNNGKRDTKEALAEYVVKNGKEYPTLWDKDGRVCEEFGIKGYPAAFLIGADGKVVWEGWPVPELSDLPGLIAKELEKAEQLQKTGAKAEAEAKAKAEAEAKARAEAKKAQKIG